MMRNSTTAASSNAWRAIPAWPSPRPATGFASCKPASTPATTHLPWRSHRKQHRCFGRCPLKSSCPTIISTQHWLGRGAAIRRPPRSGPGIWRRSQPITGRLRSGRRAGLRISPIARPCWARRWRVWKDASWMPWASTKKPFGWRASTASSRTRASPMSSPRASMPGAASRRSPRPICARPGPAICVGVPRARSANSTGSIRISAKSRRQRAATVRASPPWSSLISQPWSRFPRPFPARSTCGN